MVEKGNGDDHVTWSQLARELNHLREARELQMAETARRLEALNGEAERLRADRAESVRKEAFEVWRDGVNHDLTEFKAALMQMDKGFTRRMNLLSILMGGFGTLIGWAITYFNGRH